MKDDELLNAVFRFKHKPPSDRQEAATCSAFAKWFSSFVDGLEAAADVPELQCGRLEPLADDHVVPASVFAVHEVEALQQAAQRLTAASGRHERGDVWYDPWLPKYGCVVQRSKKNATEVTIDVVYVDKWEHKLHLLPNGESVHAAVPTGYKVLSCGDLDSELETKFSTTFVSELAKAVTNKGADRSAARNELGHQKTPQFAAAVVRRTVDSLLNGAQGVGSVSFAAQGGTTDVGLHTGGRARDTCWALVQAAIEHNLCCGESLFRKAMVAMKLKLIQQAVDEVEEMLSGNAINLEESCAAVDDAFYMLQDIVQNVAELLESAYEVSALQKQCTTLRSRVDGFVDDLNQELAKQNVLPGDAVLEQLSRLTGEMEMDKPKRVSDSSSRESVEERHQRAWANLEGCYYADALFCTLGELVQWSTRSSSSASYRKILILRTIKSFLFEKSKVLVDGGANAFHVELLYELVTRYHQVVIQWRQAPQLTSVLGVEQRSREMLVKWITFCLVHQRCVEEISLCAQYNIALSWQDLKVAVLNDQAAIAALQRVATYIRTWNTSTGRPPLFHLTNQDPTFDFALKFGLSSDAMTSIYNHEAQIWDDHVREKWSEIEAKKKRAADLRAQISRQNQNLASKRVLLANEEERLRTLFPEHYNSHCRRSTTKSQLENSIWQITSSIREKTEALSSTLAVPQRLVRPLPPAKNDAIQVIFMLTMPRNLEILGSLCLTAQRALTPSDATSEMTTLPDISQTEWQTFYSQHAPSRALQATNKIFAVSPAPFSVPRILGPQSVDDLYNLDQYSSECVWNPTINGSALTWADSFGTKVNPFAASESSVITSFTETLPLSFRKLQWMNEWPGEGDTRGNMVYANFNLLPLGFEKSSFIALASLRAFPNQQYRKLMWALLDDILPWSNSSVEIIVRQSLYQVGTLTDEAEPQLLWKSDMHTTEGLYTFCSTLETVASKLEQTPRNFENIPLLSELAGFALQYSSEAREIVRKFSRVARRWAEDARSEYKEASDPKRVGQIRQKECVLYGFALLAHTLGELDDEAAEEICELIVLFRTSFLCASINERCSALMIKTESKITEMMSRRIPGLVAYVNNHTNSVLTGLVRLVSATSPERLEWNQFREVAAVGGQFGSCFEAVDEATNVHYSVNLFTGTVLTDGYAPGGLPANIRNHERFQMLFGRSNFEVFSTNGKLRTERKFCDRFYDFTLEEDEDESEELVVEELATNFSGEITSTLQLCSIGWIESLRKLLPAQLRKLYSHWYWAEKSCVLFRPKKVECREVLFITTFDEGGSVQCYKVPFSDTKLPYETLLSNLGGYDRFVQKEKTLPIVFKILEKLEAARFLYPLRTPDDTFKIELPRFKLTFCLNSTMQFESVEHKGYVLARNQQFDDFLPRFKRYLLLELQDSSDTTRSELRMLLPVGVVEESPGGIVNIGISEKAVSRVDVHCYDVHRRLKTFETETIGARLQLAAVCTRAGVNVPNKRLQMTGAEAAVQMLRACRPSRPFSQFEKDTLLTIYQLSYREPLVRILVVALLKEADRLAFLFGQTQTINVAMSGIEEKAEYAAMCMERVQRNPLRSQLRSNEEKFVFGKMAHLKKSGSSKDVVECEPLPVADDYVKSVEMELKLFLKIETSANKQIPPLPLESATANAMGKKMLDELQVSWESYHRQPEVKLKAASDVLLGSFKTLLAEVTSRRGEMQTYL